MEVVPHLGAPTMKKLGRGILRATDFLFIVCQPTLVNAVIGIALYPVHHHRTAVSAIPRQG